MIRVLPSVLLIASCQTIPVACPEATVGPLICPEHIADYFDPGFMAELEAERAQVPDDSALAKAIDSFLAVRKKCDAT